MNSKFSRSVKNQPDLPEVLAIARAVRTARKRHGMIQTDLAGLSGTGLRFISELERGKPNVSLNKVLTVLAVLGLRLRVVEGEA